MASPNASDEVPFTQSCRVKKVDRGLNLPGQCFYRCLIQPIETALNDDDGPSISGTGAHMLRLHDNRSACGEAQINPDEDGKKPRIGTLMDHFVNIQLSNGTQPSNAI